MRGPKVSDETAKYLITIPAQWKGELENIARLYSVEEGRNITVQEMMRRAIKEKFQLEEPQ